MDCTTFITKSLEGLIIGGLLGICFLKISSLKREFQRFKTLEFEWVKKDAKEYSHDRFIVVKREELNAHINCLRLELADLKQNLAVLHNTVEERTGK